MNLSVVIISKDAKDGTVSPEEEQRDVWME